MNTTDYKQLEKFEIRMQAFISKLNVDIDASILVKTPDNKANSIPISHIEMLLDTYFFGLWKTQNFTSKQILNELVGEVELHFFHPVAKEWLVRIGAGSIVITQKKETDVKDFLVYKQKNALDLAYPKLKAECIKNAAQSIGKLFGRDINRNADKVANYSPFDITTNYEDSIKNQLNMCFTLDDIQLLYETLNDEAKINNRISSFFTKRKIQIENTKSLISNGVNN